MQSELITLQLHFYGTKKNPTHQALSRCCPKTTTAIHNNNTPWWKEYARLLFLGLAERELLGLNDILTVWSQPKTPHLWTSGACIRRFFDAKNRAESTFPKKWWHNKQGSDQLVDILIATRNDRHFEPVSTICEQLKYTVYVTLWLYVFGAGEHLTAPGQVFLLEVWLYIISDAWILSGIAFTALLEDLSPSYFCIGSEIFSGSVHSQ